MSATIEARSQRSAEGVTLTIHLLGPPRIERGGEAVPRPRGRKAWALLAFLLLAPTPVARGRLAELLFSEAGDPLGTLRWNLAELRRLLGPDATLAGDPVVIRLPPGASLDVDVLTNATWMEAAGVPGIGLELLAGIESVGGPAFEAWLTTERQRIAHLSAAVLREAATAHLAGGRADDAVSAASRLVALDEFDEESQALLVRAYRAAGGPDRARRYLASVTARIRRELGVEPGEALRSALDAPTAEPLATVHLQGAAAVESLLAAGEGAIAAGVLDAGLEILRRALASARRLGDRRLEARVQGSLGTALIHGGRGLEAQGSAALHAALGLAESAGDPDLVSSAARELGYADMKRGRYERAEAWLTRAIDAAPSDGSRGSALAVLGVVASDRGRTCRAIEWLATASEIACGLGKGRQEAWALTFLGRAHLLRAEAAAARGALERAVELSRAAGWITFLALPLSLLADARALDEGRHRMDDYQAAFALSCQIGDPCWEGMAARGIGLAHAGAGQIDDAIRWLDDARTRCMRVADAYLWIQAHCLDALCSVAVEHGVRGASGWVTDLESVAARTGMHELLARAYLHRAALGDAAARDAAEVFIAGLDNPVLPSLLDRTRARAAAG